MRTAVRRVVCFVAAGILIFSMARPALAQEESKSLPLVKELAALMDAAKIDAIAAKDPSSDDTYFAALYFPGSQLLAVSARYEVPVLLDESLTLPPIDLTLNEGQKDSTSVLILVTVDRTRMDELKARLTTVRRLFRVAAPGLVAKRSPLELLQGLRLPRVVLPTAPAGNPQDSAWREAVQLAADAGTGLLWYVRRRNLTISVESAGVAVPLPGNVRPVTIPTGGVIGAPVLGVSPTILGTGPIAPVVRSVRTAAPSKPRRRSTSRRKG